MHISDFDFDLPTDLIATEPARPRDASRMLVLDAQTGGHIDSRFSKLPEFLRPSDVLVLNNTRVIRARVRGKLARLDGTSRAIEVFFAESAEPAGEPEGKLWRVLCKPGRRIRPGDRIVFASDLYGVIGKTTPQSRENGLHEIALAGAGSTENVLERFGEIPLPPYLNRNETREDATDYQTVYATAPGAVAAPTAGLHFTQSILKAIEEIGVEILTITLHVGIGTFLPVRTEKPEEHILRPERFEIDEHTAESLRRARVEGRRIVAVGTTTTRTLEYVIREYGEFRPAAGAADIFILPGFAFKAVDALLTNFHMPRSTLLMLVSAFAGRKIILDAYSHAVSERYRFYSYGDCMLITR